MNLEKEIKSKDLYRTENKISYNLKEVKNGKDNR